MYRDQQENVHPGSADDAEAQDDHYHQTSQKANVGTLFAQIRKLRHLLDIKNESILQLQQQLDALRYSKDSATLSEKLRETNRELHIWKHRAEWAESSLYRRQKDFSSSSGAEDHYR